MDFVFYRDVFGGWRWELHDASGRTYDSQQSYDTRDECVAAANKAAPGRGGSTRADASQPQPIVLCVQPNAKLRETLQQALGTYRTVLASNSLEVMRLVNSSVFDAYVLDYSLPGSSGIHLCRHIRRTDVRTPICFYTATAGEEQRKRAFSAGASAYVCASAGPDVLSEELHALLELSELESARARAEEELAIQEELEQRAAAAIDRSHQARALAADAIERATRTKAYARFTAAGGTPAHFQRWWTPTFNSVSATVMEAQKARAANSRP